jgi:hypothetical protein
MEVSSEHYAPVALLLEKNSKLIEYDAQWTPVWAFWRRGKSHTPTGIRIPDRPALIVVPTQTTLTLFSIFEDITREPG